MTAEEFRAQYGSRKPGKLKPEKKVQSAAEQMDITSSPIQEIIDKIVVKTEYAEYHHDHILATHKGRSYRVIIVQIS